MKNSLIFLAVFICIAWACNNQTNQNAQKIIEKNNAKLVGWYESGQIDSVVGLFDDDARQMVANAAPLVGKEAIRNHWQNLTKLGTWKFTLTTVDVTQSGGLAVERGVYSLYFTPGPNALAEMQPFQNKGNYLVEWQLKKGIWLIKNDFAVSELTSDNR